MSGRYYYCIVKATVGSSTATTTSTPVLLTVKPANYSILKSGKTTFYNTIDTAISAAVSGGGDSGGGTIKVLNTITDNKTASTNKTITIDTNGKTLTRNQSIITTGGTLTIEGNGTIYCNEDTATIRSRGGNITVSDKPTIRGVNNTINTLVDTSGEVNINGGYFYSTGRSGIGLYGNGDANISSAYVYTPVKDKNAIYVGDGSTSKVTITSSTVGNGTKNSSGIDPDTTVSAALSYSSTGNLTINNSKILGGPYGANAITVYNPTTINLTGSTSLYTTNTSDTANVVWIITSGVKVTFNSTGYFYGTGSYVAATDKNYSATYTVTKGHFVSRNNKYMFYKSGAADTNYASSSSPGNRNFVYMDAYNSTTTKVIPNCYYYTKGV